MVTASHNPKDDNGYKVYWGNGCQIISPIDDQIQESIKMNSSPWIKDYPSGQSMIDHPTDKIIRSKHKVSELRRDYFALMKKTLCFYPNENQKADIKITYTAMHGVGTKYAEAAFEAFNFAPFFQVKEQVTPDPEFPTVEFPNPEEGKSALNLSIETAERNNCTLILANDPDADRLAVAERQDDDKTKKHYWKIFTGNELGALLGYWMLHCYRNRVDKSFKSQKGPAILATTVSSRFLKFMCRAEGVYFGKLFCCPFPLS